MRNVYGVRLSGCTKRENNIWKEFSIYCIVYALDEIDVYSLCERETSFAIEQIVLLPLSYKSREEYSHIITEM